MNGEPLWLEIGEVLLIHQRMISLYGGSAGLRDPNLLESALAAPKNHFAYGEQDFFVLAANYIRGIALNHPFVDGNKRTAFTTGLVFLYINGIWVSADANQAAQKVIGLIERSESVESFANWLRDNAR